MPAKIAIVLATLAAVLTSFGVADASAWEGSLGPVPRIVPNYVAA